VKSRILILILVISLGVNIGFLLRCFWPHCPLAKKNTAAAPSGWHSSSLRRDLGLSAEQAQLMEAERRHVMVQAQPLQDLLRQKRRELFVLLQSKTVPAAELDAMLDGIARLQAGIEKIYILHTLKVKGYFSPRQLQKYNGFFEQGLCPGMLPEKSCPPGATVSSGQGAVECEKTCDPKK
jgi:hypothetical protein